MSKNEFEQSKETQLLHERYQAESSEMPAASLDDAILQTAHQAVQTQTVQAGSVPVNPLRKRVWYVPAAYAAVLVLSLSVVFKLGFEPAVNHPAPASIEMLEHDSENSLLMNSKDAALQKHAKKLDEQRAQKRQQKSMKRMKSRQAKSAPRHAKMTNSMPQASSMRADETVMLQAQSSSFATAPIDIQQKNRIDELMRLYDSGEMDELKAALKIYRSHCSFHETKPYFPEKLRDLEIKWELEAAVKAP